jgi:hypothetical protein
LDIIFILIGHTDFIVFQSVEEPAFTPCNAEFVYVVLVIAAYDITSSPMLVGWGFVYSISLLIEKQKLLYFTFMIEEVHVVYCRVQNNKFQ